MAVKPKDKPTEIEILEIHEGEMSFAILGSSPFYFNSMSLKAKQSLLLGTRKKTEADKSSSLKHNPPQEFRDSLYRWLDDSHPTRLKIPAPAFKGVMGTAALVLPGTRKTEIGRLVWVTTEYVDFWGIPKLCMDVVRSADINKTPDIRTRAKVQEWAAEVTVRFIKPNLTERGIANLLAAGGIVSGVGDYRQEKGKGNFGQFRLVSLDDPEFQRLQNTAGRLAQDAAYRNFECANADTEELLDWYETEIVRRGRDRETYADERAHREAEKEAKGAAREQAKAEREAAKLARQAARNERVGNRKTNGSGVNA